MSRESLDKVLRWVTFPMGADHFSSAYCYERTPFLRWPELQPNSPHTRLQTNIPWQSMRKSSLKRLDSERKWQVHAWDKCL